MAGITLAQAEAKLQKWLDALDKVAEGQSYSISTGNGSRSLTRANLGEIQQQVEFWDSRVKKLSRGGIRVRGVAPLG